MSLVLTAAPAEEPVALADAKAHLKVETDDDDDLIAALIASARIRAEWHTGRAFVTQSWTFWLDAWPTSGIVRIPLPPLVSIESVSTYSLDDDESVLDADSYRIDAASAPGRLMIRNALSPPVVTLRAINGVGISFTAGYGDAEDVPEAIKTAIFCIVGDLYANRGDDVAPVSERAAMLLSPYRMLRL